MVPLGEKHTRDPIKPRAHKGMYQRKREHDRLLWAAHGHVRAKCVSYIHGHTVEFGWPVVWRYDECHVFQPPVDGIISDDVMTSRGITQHVEVSREEGIRRLRESWSELMHLATCRTKGRGTMLATRVSPRSLHLCLTPSLSMNPARSSCLTSTRARALPWHCL